MEISTRREGGIATVVVSGEIDAPEKAAVGKVLRDLIEDGEARLVFDFSRVTYMGSSGVSCLVEARQRVARRRGGVVLLNPPPMVRKVFRTLGLEKDFPVCGNRAAAVRLLRGGDEEE